MSYDIMLGWDELGNEVFWNPLACLNPHMLVVGTSGAGKTQTLMAIIYEFKKQGIPVIILDVHDEYDDVSDTTIDPISDDLKINPLDLSFARDVYKVSAPLVTAKEISSMLREVYKLGDIQEYLLKEAILRAYQSKGILRSMPETWYRDPPNFGDVRRELEAMLEEVRGSRRDSLESLLSRLSDIFDFELFEGGDMLSFSTMLGMGVTRLNLRTIGAISEYLQTAVMLFILRKLWNYVYSLGAMDGRGLRLVLVIDEAHRLGFESSPIHRILREARKYGISALLASQKLGDFDEVVITNTDAKLIFKLEDRDLKHASKLLGLDQEYLAEAYKEKFVAFFKDLKHPEPVRVRVWPFFERIRGIRTSGERAGTSESSIAESVDREEGGIDSVCTPPERDFLSRLLSGSAGSSDSEVQHEGKGEKDMEEGIMVPVVPEGREVEDEEERREVYPLPWLRPDVVSKRLEDEGKLDYHERFALSLLPEEFLDMDGIDLDSWNPEIDDLINRILERAGFDERVSLVDLLLKAGLARIERREDFFGYVGYRLVFEERASKKLRELLSGLKSPIEADAVSKLSERGLYREFYILDELIEEEGAIDEPTLVELESARILEKSSKLLAVFEDYDSIVAVDLRELSRQLDDWLERSFSNEYDKLRRAILGLAREHPFTRVDVLEEGRFWMIARIDAGDETDIVFIGPWLTRRKLDKLMRYSKTPLAVVRYQSDTRARELFQSLGYPSMIKVVSLLGGFVIIRDQVSNRAMELVLSTLRKLYSSSGRELEEEGDAAIES